MASSFLSCPAHVRIDISLFFEPVKRHVNRTQIDSPILIFLDGLDNGVSISLIFENHDNGQDQFYATLGVNIPLWQAPRQAAEDEARAGQRESEAGLASTRDDLAYQLSETRTRVETQKRLITLFDDRILADAKQAFEVSLAGYSSGKLPFVDLIERWRRWLGYEVQQSMNRAMLGKAVAAWTQAAGIPVTKDAN